MAAKVQPVHKLHGAYYGNKTFESMLKITTVTTDKRARSKFSKFNCSSFGIITV